MRLLLIRHGQTRYNVTGALDTAFPGAGLTARGWAQASAVPAALAREQVSAIYASPWLRAQQTAVPLAAASGLRLTVRDGLEEVSAGDLELRADPEAVQAYAASLAAWMRGDTAHGVPGGPTGQEFFDRYDQAISSLTKNHDAEDTITVFSHGAAIRVYTALAAGLDPHISTDLRIMNTGAAVLDGDPSTGWTLNRWVAEPLGGSHLRDLLAHDVTGESAEEAQQGP